MTRPWHWLSTLRPGHYWTGRKTRFRLLARLYRVGLVTHRVATKGLRRLLITSSPPSPGFAWRNDALRKSLCSRVLRIYFPSAHAHVLVLGRSATRTPCGPAIVERRGTTEGRVANGPVLTRHGFFLDIGCEQELAPEFLPTRFLRTQLQVVGIGAHQRIRFAQRM